MAGLAISISLSHGFLVLLSAAGIFGREDLFRNINEVVMKREILYPLVIWAVVSVFFYFVLSEMKGQPRILNAMGIDGNIFWLFILKDCIKK
jgi:EamA domain-containing membrane protein RarD